MLIIQDATRCHRSVIMSQRAQMVQMNKDAVSRGTNFSTRLKASGFWGFPTRSDINQSV